MTVSPPCSYYERDSLGGGSEVATPIFIQMPRVASRGAGTGNPPAGPCNLITRFDGWEAIVPLQFIKLEETHD